jgi:SAM-dependent methyltransferase
MTNSLDDVRAHYGAPGLTERIKVALAALGPRDHEITPLQLAAMDQFHTRGLTATIELAQLAGIEAGLSVLDVGCGVGGPARYLAANHGCRVTGVDLSAPFIEAARYLTGRTGQADRVRFEVADALALPFGDGAFDLVLLQHVAMNVANRPGFYRELRRVLPTGGRLAMFDVVLLEGEPYYPLPWARTPETSFLRTAEETLTLIEQAGFRPIAVRDDSEAARAWFRQLRESGPPPLPNLGVVMGPDIQELAANLGRNLMERRLGVLTAVHEAA